MQRILAELCQQVQLLYNVCAERSAQNRRPCNDLGSEEARSWSEDSNYKDKKVHHIKLDMLAEITYAAVQSDMTST